MADTIREKILDNLKTTLELINGTGGYVNTLAVQKWAMSGNNLAVTPCAVINAGPEEKDHRPGFVTSCKLTVILDVYMIAETDTDASLNSLLGDIEKALMTDYTRGSNAVNTRLMNITVFETTDGQPYAGLIITVEIEYRHRTTDPTTAV